jgi:hypothetical protein
MAHGLTIIACAMITGFLTLGWIAARAKKWNLTPLQIAFAGMICFMVVQACIVAEWVPSAYLMWALFGFFGTSGIIPYAALSQKFPTEVAGRLNTGINVLVFVAAFAAQWGIGWVIDFWPRQEGGAFAPAGYQAAFAIMLGLQALALIGSWLFRHRSRLGD